MRDLHLFDENLPSDYLTKPVTSNECSFFTLPVVDGYLWSTAEKLAGLRLKARVDGKEILLQGGDPVITSPSDGLLHITWPLTSCPGVLVMDLFEEGLIVMDMEGAGRLKWFLDLTAKDNASLPFTKIAIERIDCRFKGLNYSLFAYQGFFTKEDGVVFRITPKDDRVVLRCITGSTQP